MPHPRAQAPSPSTNPNPRARPKATAKKTAPAAAMTTMMITVAAKRKSAAKAFWVNCSISEAVAGCALCAHLFPTYAIKPCLKNLPPPSAIEGKVGEMANRKPSDGVYAC